MLVTKVTYDDVQAWVDRELAKVMAPATANAVLAALGAIMMRAERDKLIPSSPCRGVKRLRVEHHVVEVSSLADYQTVLRGLPIPYQLPAFLGLALGARACEVLGLTVDRVDYDARTITIDRQLEEGGFYVPPTWSATKGSDTRVVPVSELVLEAVRRSAPASGLLCVDEDGWPLGYDRFNYHWRTTCIECGVATMRRFHDTRHLAAELAKAGGADITEIQHRLGHKQLSTTTRFYANALTPQVASVQAMDVALACVEPRGRSDH